MLKSKTAWAVAVSCLALLCGGCMTPVSDTAAANENKPSGQVAPKTDAEERADAQKQSDIAWQKEQKRMKELREKIRKQGPSSMTKEELAEHKRLHTSLMIKMQEVNVSNFTLAGEIVDEEGKPMENVTLLLAQYKKIPWLVCRTLPRDDKKREEVLKKYTQRTTSTVNKTFSISAKNCRQVALFFKKEGYFQKSICFDPAQARGQMQRLLDSRRIHVSTVVKKGVCIVMKKKLKEEKLKAISMKIPQNISGPFYYAEFGKMLNTKQRFGYWRNQILSERKEPLVASELPAGSLGLVIGQNETNVAFKTTTRPEKNGTAPPKYEIFSELTMFLSGKNAGIILHPTQLQKDGSIWREMREAPEKGYASTVKFTPPKAVQLLGKNYAIYYFYIRTSDGKYGKGSISTYGTTKGMKQAGPRINIYMQRDGTRNLQTNGEPRA